MKDKIILIIGTAILILAIQYPFPKEAQIAKESISAPISQSTLATSTATSTAEYSPVTRIIDGDTIIATVAGVSERIRLIGVDTPETVDPRKPVQCFGKEASAFTTSLLENTTVRLQSDPTQSNRDKYGRLLRYMFLGNILVNEKIISEGYGYEYAYEVPYTYQSEFKKAEVQARDAKKGLWADGVCGIQNI